MRYNMTETDLLFTVSGYVPFLHFPTVFTKPTSNIQYMILSNQEVIPQSDLTSTIIVSRCYNDLNFFLRLRACSTKRSYHTVIVG